MDLNKVDTVLYIDPSCVNEVDNRVYGPGNNNMSWQGDDSPDFALMDVYTFGKAVRSSLEGLSAGFHSKVTDFGKYVIVDIGYHNIITGRSASKTYLIAFKNKGDGVIMSTSKKYRTVSGAQQAVSYIKSAASSLQNQTNAKLI